jgi:hypothetical protein
VPPKVRRIPVPPLLAARVQFDSDRTCCVCRVAGKPVQIHHIDEDPANNELGNLAVLCLDCHNDTQIRGGFGRKLDSDQVILYRDDWVESVARSRLSQLQASKSQLPKESDRTEFALAVAESLREAGEFSLLAGFYDNYGNEELRDKYIELALEVNPSDQEIVYLRGMQHRPDLIPDDVAERRLAKQEAHGDWSQRARTLLQLNRPVEAVTDYVKSVMEDLKGSNSFSAAFYLSELVEKGLIAKLYEDAFAQATEKKDLWWQFRSLQELGWNSEIDALLLEHHEEIESGNNRQLLSYLRRAQGRIDEANELWKQSLSSARTYDSNEERYVRIDDTKTEDGSDTRDTQNPLARDD